MYQSNAPVRQNRFEPLRGLFGTVPLCICHFAVLDKRAHNVSLSACGALVVDKPVNARACLFSDGIRLNFLSSRRELVDNRNVQIAVNQQCQRARNRGCRHDEQVNIFTFFCQGGALVYTKPVLLIDNRKRQITKLHVFTEDGVRADNHG